MSEQAGGIVGIARDAIGNFFEHRMGTYAAALAYRGLFGLFPFLLILVVLVGTLAPPGSLERLIEEFKATSSQALPQELQPVVETGWQQMQPLEEMIEQAERQAQGELLVFGIAVALWSVSALASTLIEALNTAFGLTETRRMWKVRALSLASGPVFAVAVLVAVILMLTGSQVAERVADIFGLRDLFVYLWGWLRFPVALVLLWAVLSIVYRRAPAGRHPFRSVVPAAALAVIAWAVTSVGFSIYLANFADFGVTYGSLGAAVGLLLYLYLSGWIVLMGAEFSAAIQRPDPDGAKPKDA